MKRRGFIKAIAVTPTVTTLVAQQPANPPATTSPAASPAAPGGRGGRGGGGRGGAQEVPHIELTSVDETADTATHFFTAQQFATLKKLGAMLVPPIKGSVGASDTDAAEFLDFLISASPADRQQLYRTGLDGLNTQARAKFGKPFASLDNSQADAILKPLVVPVAWVYDPPKDAMKHFLFRAHQDLRTATRNSPLASAPVAPGARRGGFGGGLYWNPIDPV